MPAAKRKSSASSNGASPEIDRGSSDEDFAEILKRLHIKVDKTPYSDNITFNNEGDILNSIKSNTAQAFDEFLSALEKFTDAATKEAERELKAIRLVNDAVGKLREGFDNPQP